MLTVWRRRDNQRHVPLAFIVCGDCNVKMCLRARRQVTSSLSSICSRRTRSTESILGTPTIQGEERWVRDIDQLSRSSGRRKARSSKLLIPIGTGVIARVLSPAGEGSLCSQLEHPDPMGARFRSRVFFIMAKRGISLGLSLEAVRASRGED